MLTFALVNLVVCVGALSAASCFKFTGALHLLLGIFTFFISQIMLSLLLAGVLLGELNPPWVATINLVITLILLALAHRYRRRTFLKFWRTAFHGRLQWLTELYYSPWALSLLLITLVVIGWLVYLAFLLPPYDYDGLWYHLPEVVAWIQAGKVVITPYSIWTNVYPANTELFFCWLMLFLHSDLLVRLGQFVFAGAGALAVMGLGRAMGLKYASVVAGGCLFFLTPIVLLQATTDYVDVAFASMFLIFFYFLFCSIEQWNAGNLVLAGLAGGITIGMKSTGLIYIGICFPLLLSIIAYRRRMGRNHIRNALILLCVPIVLLGSFWYLRTWVVYGNPIYPVTIHFLGVALPGTGTVQSVVIGANVPKELVGHSWWQQIWLSWRSEPPNHGYNLCIYDQAGRCLSYQPGYYIYDQRLGGFGPQWTYLELPALLIFAGYTLYKLRFLFFAFLLPFSLAFLLQPANWWSRYTIFLVAPGVIALAFAVEKLPRRWLRWSLQAACLLLVLISLYFSSVQLYSAPDLVRHIEALPAQERTMGNIWYPEYRWVDAIPPGSRIGFTGYTAEEWTVFPLFGPKLENQVFMIQAHDHTSFMELLEPLQVQYLFTSADSNYARWANGDPSHFRLMASYGKSCVYHISW